ncbi:hypothetical protein [Mycoplasmopsis bovis]|nr:hypothetical protein [Mycoplasmopsis bovis]WNV99821.1 hypothetical protein RSD73_02600 [Mycoplasmopsis bovis]
MAIKNLDGNKKKVSKLVKKITKLCLNGNYILKMVLRMIKFTDKK